MRSERQAEMGKPFEFFSVLLEAMEGSKQGNGELGLSCSAFTLDSGGHGGGQVGCIIA